MKALLKKIVGLFFELLTLRKNVIVFESNPDFSDNTLFVFNELLRRGYNKKYKFVWLLYGGQKDYPKYKNVKYVNANNAFTRIYYKHKAKGLIFCNRFFENLNKKQVTFFLQHGAALKATPFYVSGIPQSTNYVFSISPFMADIDSHLYGLPRERFIPLGFARNDEMFFESVSIKELFPERDFSHIIAWYPTVRQNKNYVEGRVEVKKPISIIWDMEVAKEINDFAKERDTLLIVKVHPAQKNEFDGYHFSNIVFIDNGFLKEKNVSSYVFLKSCDALLTDYSSVYYDYMLCDKPIGFVWEDYDEFVSGYGFSIGEEMLEGGEKIYSSQDLKEFIKNVSLGRDVNKENRHKVRDKAFSSIDGHYSEAIADFIISKL